MTCFRPLKAYRSPQLGSSGKRLLTFNPHKNHVEGSALLLPCGKCIGCRIDRTRQWAARCMHEAKMHPANCFLTLTYAPAHLPEDYSVSVRELQLFMKRLRFSLPHKIRFFACGEYGSENGAFPFQPHYHALIFNHQFPDLKLYNYSKNQKPNYTSLELSKLWPFGLATTADVNYQTAAYVARYSIKKINGDPAADHYTRIHPLSGNLVRVKPEFGLQSRRPGLGMPWLVKFKSDVYPSDFIVVDGKKHPIPRYYTVKLTEEEQTKVKRARKRESLKHKADNTKERLLVREEVTASRIKTLKRNL